uniref:Uncharacterized protein n=1 Tax=Megaselia scalaris TaxID=36166 RepID=T1H1Y5_MEGSC
MTVEESSFFLKVAFVSSVSKEKCSSDNRNSGKVTVEELSFFRYYPIADYDSPHITTVQKCRRQCLSGSRTLTDQLLQGPVGIGIGVVFGFLYGLALVVLPSRRSQ